MITLGSIEIEGFGSIIKPIKYKINNPGLNKIEGPNGVGKTTITNALGWVGWGKLVKPNKSSFKPWPHIIDDNYQGTKVTLKFNDGKDKFKIIRCDEYRGKILGKAGKNRLIILKNGVELNEKGLRDKKDYQKWIVNKIGYSFNLFKSSVLFTQELDNLMQEDGPSRKKIFDEAFETTFVNIAKEKVEKRLENKTEDYKKLLNDYVLIKEKIKGVKNSLKYVQSAINNFKEIKEKKISETEDEIINLEYEIEKVNRVKKENKAISKKIEELEKTISQKKELRDKEFKFDMEITGMSEKKENLENSLPGLMEAWKNPKKTCSECGKPIDKDNIISHKAELKKKYNDVKGEIKQLEAEIKNMVNTHIKLQQKLSRVESIEAEISILTKKIKPNYPIGNLTKKLNLLKDKLIKIKNEKPLFEEKLSSLNEELKEIRVKLINVKVEKKKVFRDLMVDKWLIKDPLSNAGLKAFIFDSMLGRLNNYLGQYKNLIGFGVKVYIDMSTAHKDIRILIERGGDQVPYEDLSKGQKQLVNVILSFSLSDTVQSIKPINCIFLDELFESLSKVNREKITTIITKKANNKCIHLITHHEDFAPPNCHITSLELNDKKQTILN